MKKFFSALLICLCCFLLVGCLETQSGKQILTTKQTSFDAWQYYYDFETVNNNMSNKISSSSEEGGFSFVQQNANMHFLTSALRNSMATIDVFNKGESVALFQYEKLKDYKVTQITAGKKYSVSYVDFFERNIVSNADSEVDNLIFEIGLKVQNEISIEKSSSGVYSIRITQNITPPTEIQAFLQTNTDSNNVTTSVCRQVTTNNVGTGASAYTKTTVKAEKVIKNQQGQVTSTYSRQVEFYKQNNVNYMKETVSNGQTSTIQTFRLDNTFSSIYIKYVPETGYLNYEVGYNLNGRVKMLGEMYFQGQGSYIHKRYIEILQGEPFGLKQSFVEQSNIKEQEFAFKTSYSDVKNFDLSDQDMSKFAVYNNEKSCICASYKNKQFNIKTYKG